MNRDSALWLVVGLLAGFIAGYLTHETMAARQPQVVLQAAAAAPAAAPPPMGGGMVAAPAAGPGTAAMPDLQALRKLVEAEPNNADAIVALANMNFDIQSWDRAVELYQRYDKLRPGDPNVITDLGIAFRGLGQFDQALEHFRRAQSLSSTHWQSRFNEVIVLAFDKRDFVAADAALARLRQVQPANPEVDRLAGEIARLRAGS